MTTVAIDPETRAGRIKARRTMTWLTIVAICMLFAGWFSGYLVSMSAGYWTRITLPVAFVYSTVMVLAGSGTVHMAVIAARQEAIEAAGGHAFLDYQVPQAVIKLKQGFGRLIRTAADTGLVVILDPRVLTKGYGAVFLEALPECRRFVDGQPAAPGRPQRRS